MSLADINDVTRRYFKASLITVIFYLSWRISMMTRAVTSKATLIAVMVYWSFTMVFALSIETSAHNFS